MSAFWIVVLVLIASAVSFSTGRKMTEREVKEVEELSTIIANVADDIIVQMANIEERLDEYQEDEP